MKITKKLLKDYARYQREIPLLEQELHKMNTSEAGLGSSTILNYNKGYPIPQTIVGFDQILYDRRRKILMNKKDKVAAVEQWIEAIENIQTRTVFRMRYMQQRSWTQIAKEIGYEGNADYVRIVIRDRFLEKNNIR